MGVMVGNSVQAVSMTNLFAAKGFISAFGSEPQDEISKMLVMINSVFMCYSWCVF